MEISLLGIAHSSTPDNGFSETVANSGGQMKMPTGQMRWTDRFDGANGTNSIIQRVGVRVIALGVVK